MDIDDPEKIAFCPACGAGLEIEIGGAGFALVSAQGEEEDTPQIPEEEQEPDPIHDPVLADHMRWRVGAVFTALFGLTVLGCAVFSGFSEYSEKGMWALTRGREATFLWVITSLCLILLIGSGVVYSVSRSETNKYLKSLEEKKEQLDDQRA
ncbi:MAG: hypothetical protein JEZ02_20915 [Desulfatibacillum sp.]|nr:hypothetical protein [Desulfatibacillum sp.]